MLFLNPLNCLEGAIHILCNRERGGVTNLLEYYIGVDRVCPTDHMIPVFHGWGEDLTKCSYYFWADFRMHSYALQIHFHNFGIRCTSCKLEEEKLKPPWLTLLQLISPWTLTDTFRNWTYLLLSFCWSDVSATYFISTLENYKNYAKPFLCSCHVSATPLVTPFSPLTHSLWCGWSNFLLLRPPSLLLLPVEKNWTTSLAVRRHILVEDLLPLMEEYISCHFFRTKIENKYVFYFY